MPKQRNGSERRKNIYITKTFKIENKTLSNETLRLKFLLEKASEQTSKNLKFYLILFNVVSSKQKIKF